MSKISPSESHPVGTPFPLQRSYYTRVVPIIFLFMVALAVLIWFAFHQVTRNIYLQQNQTRAGFIVDALKDSAPDAWQAFLSDLATPSDLDILSTAFAEQIERQKLISLKVYDLRGKVIYDSKGVSTGTLETSKLLREVIVTLKPTLVRKLELDGSVAYEIYAPHLDPQGNLLAIFELYERVGYLDSLLIETAVPAIAVPTALMLVLMLVLGGLVRRAQLDIDERTTAIGKLSHRLEAFMSSSAINAAKNADASETIPSCKMTCTLFHSDIRDFTSYAENNTPERVVFFLNDLMTIQVEIITKFGGDVDKMIGDALLVRFEGRDAEKRAIDAAKAILDALDRASLARGLGIGIYTGQVISGAVGPKSRRDFTVIGDSVNMSARLCAHAQSGEVVVDTQTIRTARSTDFKDEEVIKVKGHAELLHVHRWNIQP